MCQSSTRRKNNKFSPCIFLRPILPRCIAPDSLHTICPTWGTYRRYVTVFSREALD